MSLDYITLSTLDDSLVKKFRVWSGGHEDMRTKKFAVNNSWTGKLDHQTARSVNIKKIVLLVFETDPTDPAKSDSDTEGFGILSDVRVFFEKNSVETGSIGSDYDYIEGCLIKFTDFDESEYYVLPIGDYRAQNLSKLLHDMPAIYKVPLELIVWGDVS